MWSHGKREWLQRWGRIGSDWERLSISHDYGLFSSQNYRTHYSKIKLSPYLPLGVMINDLINMSRGENCINYRENWGSERLGLLKYTDWLFPLSASFFTGVGCFLNHRRFSIEFDFGAVDRFFCLFLLTENRISVESLRLQISCSGNSIPSVLLGCLCQVPVLGTWPFWFSARSLIPSLGVACWPDCNSFSTSDCLPVWNIYSWSFVFVYLGLCTYMYICAHMCSCMCVVRVQKLEISVPCLHRSPLLWGEVSYWTRSYWLKWQTPGTGLAPPPSTGIRSVPLCLGFYGDVGGSNSGLCVCYVSNTLLTESLLALLLVCFLLLISEHHRLGNLFLNFY